MSEKGDDLAAQAESLSYKSEVEEGQDQQIIHLSEGSQMRISGVIGRAQKKVSPEEKNRRCVDFQSHLIMAGRNAQLGDRS